jgi:peptide/nickel transport system ATP-binding protein
LLAVAGDGGHSRRERPTLLKGEPPDPTRIPSGCRFHPRCPALADGRAEAAGIASVCTTASLPILPSATGKHVAACLLHDQVRGAVAAAG